MVTVDFPFEERTGNELIKLCHNNVTISVEKQNNLKIFVSLAELLKTVILLSILFWN